MFKSLKTTNNKSVILLMVVIMVSSILSACTQDKNKPGSPEVSASANSQPEASVTVQPQSSTQPQQQAYPLTVTDSKNKNIELTSKPERVAVTDYVIFSHLVSLDYYPMAANMYDSYITLMESMKTKLAGKKIENLGEWDAINLEKTASLEPDLILSSTADAEKVYEQLDAIAPVIFYDPVKMGNTETDWKWGLRELAKVIDETEKAEQVIASVEQVMADKKPSFVAQQDKTAVFFFYSKNRGGFTMQSYQALKVYFEGLGITPAIRNEEVQTLSMEGLAELNPDYIFIFDTDGSVAKEMQELDQDKVWNRLSAVKNNNVSLVNFSMAVMSPVNILYGIDVIDQAMNR